MIRRHFFLLILALLAGCGIKSDQQLHDLKIAFLSDVHFHDVYCDFSDADQTIITNPLNNKNATIRTMQAQLYSTRLFNENYFAFLAALDDIAYRGIKYVAFPGDFSDNGQLMNVRGVKKVLDEYSEKYNISFFITTGNHDPARPYLSEGGHLDFLGKNGKMQAVLSKERPPRQDNDDDLPVIYTKDLQNLGYQEITDILRDYGFFPEKNYLYWETPFSDYNYADYNFDEALRKSSLENRMYEMNPHALKVPDVSYLVEPLKGLWLLAIDANVYPLKEVISDNPEDPANFSGSGAGYNNVFTHRKYLIDWITSVAERARQNNKILIAFSHYPLIEFLNDTSPEIARLLGDDKMHFNRLPSEEVNNALADAGLTVHFAGHMHINDTGLRRTEKGNTLINIQVPSPAAYPPGYKILTIKGENLLEIETVVLDSVPRFNELFDLYRIEHNWLSESKSPNIWNIDILTSRNYPEFVNWHMKELVRLRLFPSEWPEDLKVFLPEITGEDILILSQLNDKEIPDEEQNKGIKKINKDAEYYKKAKENAIREIEQNGFTIDQFAAWSGSDLVFDFYRLKNADELALKDIGETRVKQYLFLNELFAKKAQLILSSGNPGLDHESQQLGSILKIMCAFINGQPSGHIQVDMGKGKIKRL